MLPPQEANLFFRLQKTLLCFAHQQLRISGHLLSLEDFDIPRPEEMLKVRDALIQKPEVLDSFVRQNPAHLFGDALAIVSSWRHQVAGRFCIFRALKNYTVFLSTGGSPVAYGVIADTCLKLWFESLCGITVISCCSAI